MKPSNEEKKAAEAAPVQRPKPEPNWPLMRKLSWIQTGLSVPKDRRNAANPELEYRNIEDICAAAAPLLEDAGCALTFSEELREAGGRVYVASTATLSDGNGSIYCTAFAREDDVLPEMCGAQITGACTSYARKYAAAGLLAIGSGRRLAVHTEIDALDQTQAQSLREKAAAGEAPAAPSPVRRPYATEHPLLVPGFGGWDEEIKAVTSWKGTQDAYLRDLASRYAFNEETLNVLLSKRTTPFVSGE